MKKTLFFAACCTAALLAAQENKNPVTALFPEDISFSVPFDDGTCNADLSAGSGEPFRFEGDAKFADGLFGKALSSGRPWYKVEQGDIDMTSPGTVLFWVAPVNTPSVKGDLKTEPGFTAFGARGGGHELYIGKMGGQPWDTGHLNTYVQYDGGKGGHVNCVNYGAARCSQWPNGEWRMFAVTWGNGSFTSSINGKKSQQSELKKPIANPTKEIFIGVDKGGTYQYLVDEVVVLKRQLSDEEIAKVYTETLKVLPKK